MKGIPSVTVTVFIPFSLIFCICSCVIPVFETSIPFISSLIQSPSVNSSVFIFFVLLTLLIACPNIAR